NHHPYYQHIAVELPDNWALNTSYNLPLDEFTNLMVSALEKGYSLGWDGDVSEKSFSQKKGVATLPKLDWAMRNKVERDSLLLKLEPEMKVDQALRQKMFDNYQTTDDHLMHITGYQRIKTVPATLSQKIPGEPRITPLTAISICLSNTCEEKPSHFWFIKMLSRRI
ncbi:MAG: hypothetical protein AAFP70_11320, partial [Calditrichota bacterium]